ncbi:hypothetical protein BLOT_003084 [Blomia tropicalis]|nr:hypothetical protein BLOT_003084 [Blomia tropicalis]
MSSKVEMICSSGANVLPHDQSWTKVSLGLRQRSNFGYIERSNNNFKQTYKLNEWKRHEA